MANNKKRLRFYKPLDIFVAVFMALFLFASYSDAAFISPKRVMIDDGERTGVVALNNRSDETLVYSFNWERRGQMPDGTIVPVPEGETIPGYRPADDYLLFSPRRVIVEPGDTQRVRILARRTRDMAEGEYHTHFRILSTPVVKTPKTSIGTGQVGGTLAVRTSVSIPVFLRHGETVVDFQIKEARLTQEGEFYYINLAFDNASTRSIYARPEVLCYKGGEENPTAVRLPTMRVYSELRSYQHKFSIAKSKLDIGACQSVKMQLIALNDFEYKGKNPIFSLDLK